MIESSVFETSVFETRLKSFSERLQVSGVVAGVVDVAGRLNAAAYGLRRRSGEEKIRLDDKVHIGSCTKSITAMLFALLVREGAVAWQDPIASVFNDLGGEVNRDWAERTFEELFFCTAGMRANPSLARMFSGYKDKRSLTDQRTEAVSIALKQKPGQRGKFVYSNLGYIVVGAAIDRLTASSYEQALQRYVAKPLGITSVGYGAPEKVCGHGSRLRLGNYMMGRGKAAEPGHVRSDNPRVLSSAGTLHVTLSDWSKIVREFLVGGNQLLTSDEVDYLLKPPDNKPHQMAKGWVRAQGSDALSYGMQGSNTMWSAAALLNHDRTKAGLMVCNDGRTRVVMNSPGLVIKLLEADVKSSNS